ncbi:hypothetical protein BJ742DRAFT_768134 [Cladochytrium replicatum]|nr:hypothetical protein BJ742DRAFT_768134 [Cladochytrium replicatum]
MSSPMQSPAPRFAEPVVVRRRPISMAVAARNAAARISQCFSEPPNDTTASIYMVASALAFTVMNTCVKVLSVKEMIPTFEIVHIRSIVMTLCTMVIVFLENDDDGRPWIDVWFGAAKVRPMLVLRGVIGFLSTSCSFWSVTLLPLPIAVIISFIHPVITGILAFFILKEPLTTADIIAAVFSTIGVVVVAQPSPSFMGTPSPADPTDSFVAALFNVTTVDQMFVIGIIIALLGAFFTATGLILLRFLGPRTKPYHNVLYFSIGGAVLSLVTSPMFPQPWVMPPDIESWVLLIVGSLTGFIGQLCLSYALKRAVTAARICVVNYSTVLFSFIAQWAVFASPPGLMSVIGALIVGGSVCGATLAKTDTPTDTVGATTKKALTGDIDEEEALVAAVQEVQQTRTQA